MTLSARQQTILALLHDGRKKTTLLKMYCYKTIQKTKKELKALGFCDLCWNHPQLSEFGECKCSK